MKTKGRPKNSRSTTPVRLCDLNKHIPPNGIVHVGTTWMKNYGFNIKNPAVVEIVSVNPTPENTKIEVTDVKFD